jgi:hypothetical protein
MFWLLRCAPLPGFLLLFAFGVTPQISLALGQQHYVTSTNGTGSFPLAADGRVARIYVDGSDWPGVIRAAHDLQADIQRVTGVTPELSSEKSGLRGEVILIGTVSKSPLIDRLVQQHKLDVSQIRGKWESTLIQVVDKPMPGVARALVVAGSDKRGTIFGIYDVSEQIGVSPWYWWADVPVPHQDSLYVAAGRYVEGEPAVKYRGIFLNDEAPALTGWVNTTYGGYNSKFYTKVFELLLRLKANYLWPAMWNSAFNEDDPENPRLADEYGIVMGTSHHEPMLRAQQEWKRHGTGPWDYSTNSAVLDKFWAEGIERNKNYESTITLAMRGDGDMPMTEGANISLLEKIVADQLKILDAHMTPTLASDPKVWALYKEVQAYYEKGMRVPDQITLLWCDDNWGNIRRLPTPEERNRPGGAGIYYHFDYVGDPRNYKWINTNPISKVWEQMHLARAYGADRIWIVNVGDLKPMEFPIEFFLSYARNPDRWTNDNLDEFTQLWATREFGGDHAKEIAELVTRYGQYAGRRKPELLEPDTFSLVNYREADRVEAEWDGLVAKAQALQKQIPANQQDAYFELVLHPIEAYAIVCKLYIAAGRNHLYAREGRTDANDYAQQARDLFKADAELSNQYNHVLAHGKWNHMMDQTHIGYTYWQQPPLNAMPAVSEVQPAADAQMGLDVEGAAGPFGPPSLNFDSFGKQTRSIEVFNRGLGSFRYQASAADPWVLLDTRGGDVGKQDSIHVSIDWSKAPEGRAESYVTITETSPQPGGPAMKIRVDAFHPATPSLSSLGAEPPTFIEGDGYVSMEAEHYSNTTAAGDVHWERIPNYGLTLSGMTVAPVTAGSVAEPRAGASLEYRMYLFDSGAFNVEATLSPTLNFVPGRGLRFSVAIDDQPPQVIDALEHNTDKDWAKAVSDSVRRVEAKVNVSEPGYHTLRIGMIDPGIVVEKLVVSAGALKPSYLGPPESFRTKATNR